MRMANDFIAVVGMAGRFPGAGNLAQFWSNLSQGLVARRQYTDEELSLRGVTAELLSNPNYVKAGYPLDDVDLFDAEFFKITPREAAITDPQQRLFLECVWTALESAGYDPTRYQGNIGLYAGSKMNSYLLNNLHSAGADQQRFDSFELLLGNDKDYLTSRISYKLNLKGPSVVVQTACSSSLVAVHFACEALLSGDCDMAVAGGVSVRVPVDGGYYFQKGAILSPDGFCRAYSQDANGTTEGNGLGAVVLRRLADAIEDGDQILAVVRGSAVNNDGSEKLCFTAPSGEGQGKVIAEALHVAGVDPGEITLLEGHGTGTPLGDPVEVAALSQTYREHSDRTGYCALGSVKANIGHLDTAAGIASFIKVILALQHRTIPPLANYSTPNPDLGLEHSPFYIPADARAWEAPGSRIAGVTSLGIGGTNCHVIVEEAPAPAAADATHLDWHLLTLSARSPKALDEMTRNLASHIENHDQLALADVAWTLLEGRKELDYRRGVLCRDRNEALRALRGGAATLCLDAHVESTTQPYWMEIAPFKGDAMREVARCCRTLPALANELKNLAHEAGPHLSIADSLDRLTSGIAIDAAFAKSAEGRLMQLSLLVALARWLQSVGLSPQAWFGDETVCSVLTGALSLEEAFRRTASTHATAPVLSTGADPPPSALVMRLGGEEVCSLTSGRQGEATLPPGEHESSPIFNVMRAVASAWAGGTNIKPAALYHDEKRRRVLLPTYPFEYQRHWVDPVRDGRIVRQGKADQTEIAPKPPAPKPGGSVHYYASMWAQVPVFRMNLPRRLGGKRVLVVGDGAGVAQRFVHRLQELGAAVTHIVRSSSYRKIGDGEYLVDTTSATDYHRCLEDLAAADAAPRYILYCPSTNAADDELGLTAFWESMAFVQGVGRVHPQKLAIAFVTCNAQDILNRSGSRPGRAVGESFIKCVPLEYPQIEVKLLDMDEAEPDELSLGLVLDDLLAPSSDVIAYREGSRWKKGIRPVALTAPGQGLPSVSGGTLLVTGGLGAIALQLCTHLAARGPCRLILLARNDSGSRSARVPEASELFLDELRDSERDLRAQETAVTAQDYEGFSESLGQLAVACTIEFLKEHRPQIEPGRQYDIGTLAGLITSQPRLDAHVRFLLRTLLNAGVLLAGPDGKVTIGPQWRQHESGEKARAGVLEAYPQFAGMVELYSHCVSHYPALFRGETAPLQVLYPDGTSRLFELAYQNSARHGSSERCCHLLLQFIRKRRARYPVGPLRILEVGGGNGSLTRILLPSLTGVAIEYCFTDISRSFVSAAQVTAKAQGFDSVSFATFDITRDGEAQGFLRNSFDIIVGLDVVHATANINSTLNVLVDLLKPGGTLGLVETTRDDLWLTLVMGQTDGWWAFDDDRKDSPLLSPAAWEEKLRAAQLGAFTVLPEVPSDTDDCSLILLQKPQEAVEEDPSRTLNRHLQLENLRKQGAEITILRADVSDAAELSAALRSLGPERQRIDGIIHTAGIVDGKLFQQRTRADVEEVLAPKVDGVRNLYREFRDQPLSLWVNCSSIIAVNGGVGQFAHCAANQYLDHFTAYLRRHGQPNAISINWEAWHEIGQAEESRRRFNKRWTDRFAVQRGRRGGLLRWSELSDTRYTVYETTVSASDWFLAGHRLRGEPVLPGTMFVELAVEAAKSLFGDKAMELSDVRFVAPLFVARGSVRVLTVLERRETGHEFMILSVTSDLDRAHVHVTGKVRPSPAPGTVTFDLADLEARCTGSPLDERVEDNDARWQCLARAVVEGNMALAEMRLPEEFADEAGDYHLHPAMLDIAIAFLPLKFRKTSAFVPVHYSKISVFEPLSSHAFSFARLRGGATAEAASIELNVTVLDSAGRRLADIEKLTLRRVTTETETPDHSARESRLLEGFQNAARARGASWLTPVQGLEAFDRILASGLPQVIPTGAALAHGFAAELGGQEDHLETERSEARTGADFGGNLMKARPALSSEYIGAGSRTERVLAGIWSTVLGIENVGIDDNFFELGGDSLLSIQVSSLVGTQIGIEVPSGMMFEFPTIQKFARFIDRRTQQESEASAEVPAANGHTVAEPEERDEERAGDLLAVDRLVSDIRKRLDER